MFMNCQQIIALKFLLKKVSVQIQINKDVKMFACPNDDKDFVLCLRVSSSNGHQYTTTIFDDVHVCCLLRFEVPELLLNQHDLY